MAQYNRKDSIFTSNGQIKFKKRTSAYTHEYGVLRPANPPLNTAVAAQNPPAQNAGAQNQPQAQNAGAQAQPITDPTIAQYVATVRHALEDKYNLPQALANVPEEHKDAVLAVLQENDDEYDGHLDKADGL